MCRVQGVGCIVPLVLVIEVHPQSEPLTFFSYHFAPCTLHPRFKVWGSECGVWGVGSLVPAVPVIEAHLGFRVQGVGCREKGVACGV